MITMYHLLEDMYIIEKNNIESTSVLPNYPLLKNEVDYDPSINKSVDKTYYQEIILKHCIINTASKDSFIYTILK